MPTMADIAKRAGVSLSTVSHALSGKRHISEATKVKIFEAMAALDYEPNALARGLATRRSKIIGLLLPFQVKGLLEAQFDFVTSAAEAASTAGYSLALWTSPAENMDVRRMIQNGFIDGLILMEIRLDDPRVELLRARAYPFTLIGHCRDNDRISFIDVDFEYTIRECVEYLAGLGHRHIALISHSPHLYETGYGPAVRSVQGFRQAIQDCGLAGIVRLSEPTPEASYADTQALLAEEPSLSAIISTAEVHVRGIVQAIRDAGRHIPDDFSLIGFVTSRQDGLAALALTAVDFPASEMGRIGTELLIKQLDGQAAQPEQILLRPPLTIRQSTGPYKVR